VGDYGASLVDGFARDARVAHVTVLADRVAGAPSVDRAGRVEIRRVWQRDRADIGLQLMRAIAGTRADIVWFNLGLSMFGTRPVAAASGIASTLGAKVLGRRTVVTIHELPALADLDALGFAPRPARAAGDAMLRVVRCADGIVLTLERYRAHLAERMPSASLVHIPHGLWARAEPLPEPADETVLVFGTFGPHKDPGIVAEAVARLRETRPGLRLLIAGADHPRYPGFMARCRERHRLGNDWLGYVPREELGALFARARVVVVPSLASSGSSGVVHRAVGYGRPVLVSDLPDFRAQAAEDDLAFAWFAAGDPGDLARSLALLLDDRARRAQLAAHNLRALAGRSPARIVDAYLALFLARSAVRAGEVAVPRARLEHGVEA
jgi:glycosyltransferase involved in cell wall biosynthesis